MSLWRIWGILQIRCVSLCVRSASRIWRCWSLRLTRGIRAGRRTIFHIIMIKTVWYIPEPMITKRCLAGWIRFQRLIMAWLSAIWAAKLQTGKKWWLKSSALHRPVRQICVLSRCRIISAWITAQESMSRPRLAKTGGGGCFQTSWRFRPGFWWKTWQRPMAEFCLHRTSRVKIQARKSDRIMKTVQQPIPAQTLPAQHSSQKLQKKTAEIFQLAKKKYIWPNPAATQLWKQNWQKPETKKRRKLWKRSRQKPEMKKYRKLRNRKKETAQYLRI